MVGLAVALALVVPSVVSVPLTVLFVVVSGNPVEIVGFPVVAAVGTLGFALPSVFLLVKFWFAPETCVIGRYGPIDSLRVSWRLTTDYRRKYLLVLLIVIGSVLTFDLLGPLVQVYGDTVIRGPVLRALSVSIEELLSVVWVGAYAHIYVQEVIQL